MRSATRNQLLGPLLGVIAAFAVSQAAATEAQPTGPLPPGHPPLGPADVIRRTTPQPSMPNPTGGQPQGDTAAEGDPGQAAGDGAEGQIGQDGAGDTPAGTPEQPTDGQMGQPQPPDDDIHRMVSGDAPRLSVETPSDNVPPGEIHVQVADAAGQPVANASVIVGVLVQGSGREQKTAESNASGLAVFRDLPTGSGQAYRVRVPHEGAVYASTPFQLPIDRGYLVQIKRLGVTHEDRNVLQGMGFVMIELKDGRAHVTQQAQLMNFGQETYLFPSGGQRVDLPDGFTAFQSQESMTDQHIEPKEDSLMIHGSLPPGQTMVTWAYDVPLSGSDLRLTFDLPWRTIGYRAMSDAPPGAKLSVTGLPDADLIEDDGRKLFITEIQRRPGDPSLDRIELHLAGIPGPGPMRWIAVVLASLFVLAGLAFVFSRSSAPAGATARAARQQRLLDEVTNLERDFIAGKVGPRYHERRKEEISTELADLLHAKQTTADKATTKRAAT